VHRPARSLAALAALAALPVLTAFAGPPPAGGKPGGKASAAPVATEAPTLGQNLNQMYEPFKWGMNHAEVIKVHNQTGGVFDLDYNPQLAKLQPGVKMQALEAERDSKKSAFAASWVEFKDTPTGYDQTGIKDEYTYRNKESIMYVDRNARRRYFFFIGDRLWKIYDEVSFSEQSGKTFTEVVTKLNTQLGTPGRIRAADAAGVDLLRPVLEQYGLQAEGRHAVVLLDRRKYPFATEYVTCRSVEETALALLLGLAFGAAAALLIALFWLRSLGIDSRGRGA